MLERATPAATSSALPAAAPAPSIAPTTTANATPTTTPSAADEPATHVMNGATHGDSSPPFALGAMDREPLAEDFAK
jgi:hypothetical protein